MGERMWRLFRRQIRNYYNIFCTRLLYLFSVTKTRASFALSFPFLSCNNKSRPVTGCRSTTTTVGDASINKLHADRNTMLTSLHYGLFRHPPAPLVQVSNFMAATWRELQQSPIVLLHSKYFCANKIPCTA